MNDRHLRSGLERTQGTVDGHPAADTLCGFRERRLRGPDRAVVAGHLAGCAACREVLALSASQQDGAGFRWRPALLRLAAAAVLILAFTGTVSRIDEQVVRRIVRLEAWRALAPIYTGEHSPAISYASAELTGQAVPVMWRIRKSGASAVLEQSADAGFTWRTAKMEARFEPAAVGFKGRDVWVTGSSGETLVSRDAGQRWIRLRAMKTR